MTRKLSLRRLHESLPAERHSRKDFSPDRPSNRGLTVGVLPERLYRRHMSIEVALGLGMTISELAKSSENLWKMWPFLGIPWPETTLQ